MRKTVCRKIDFHYHRQFTILNIMNFNQEKKHAHGNAFGPIDLDMFSSDVRFVGQKPQNTNNNAADMALASYLYKRPSQAQ